METGFVWTRDESLEQWAPEIAWRIADERRALWNTLKTEAPGTPELAAFETLVTKHLNPGDLDKMEIQPLAEKITKILLANPELADAMIGTLIIEEEYFVK